MSHCVYNKIISNVSKSSGKIFNQKFDLPIWSAHNKTSTTSLVVRFTFIKSIQTFTRPSMLYLLATRSKLVSISLASLKNKNTFYFLFNSTFFSTIMEKQILLCKYCFKYVRNQDWIVFSQKMSGRGNQKSKECSGTLVN